MGRSWGRCGAACLAVALLALLGAAAAARPLPKLAEPDYTLYHTMDRIFQEVRDIVQSCPGTMRLHKEVLSEGNYSTTLTLVTVEPGGLTEGDHSDKLRLLLNFGEHGRELISSEIALRLLRLLCQEELQGPLLDAYRLPRDAIRQLLRRSVFKIVPMENIRGRERVEAGDLCERKNGRGVDPNRNWDMHWGYKERDYDPREEYPGTRPFSEPEAALLLRTAGALRPHVWASVHSGMAALFMPYDHQAHIPEGPGPAATLSILERINDLTCSNKCAVGSGGKSVGYLAHGTATDYMYEKLGVPISTTWEVYGDEKARFEDCFRMFNPLTAEVYNATVESWTAAFFALLSMLPQHPDVAADVPGLPGAAAADAATAAAAGGGSDALGRRGAVGGAQQAAAGGTAARETAGVDPAAGGSSADKALEIASALKEHMQQQQQQQEEEAGPFEQQQQAGGAAGLTGLRGGGLASGAVAARRPRVRRSRTVEVLYWVMVAVTGCGLASYLWSKPRVRYQLSKWLGSSLGRRRSRLIPL